MNAKKVETTSPFKLEKKKVLYHHEDVSNSDLIINDVVRAWTENGEKKREAVLSVEVPGRQDSDGFEKYLNLIEVMKLRVALQTFIDSHTELMKDDRLLTSHEAAGLLQMDPSSIVKWVNDGLLPAFRTPGKHRRIKAVDLADFLRKHGMFVPAALGGIDGK